jgi:hypothetical protein
MRMRRCWTKMMILMGTSTSKLALQYILYSVLRISQVVRRRGPVIQNSSLCNETFVLYHRNEARVVSPVVQRGVSDPYLPVRRPRGDGPPGGMGNLRYTFIANSTVRRRIANQGFSRCEAEADPGRIRPRGDGLHPFAVSGTCVGQSSSKPVEVPKNAPYDSTSRFRTSLYPAASASGFPLQPGRLHCVDIQSYSITASVDVQFNVAYFLSAIRLFLLLYASPTDVLELVARVDTRSPQDSG